MNVKSTWKISLEKVGGGVKAAAVWFLYLGFCNLVGVLLWWWCGFVSAESCASFGSIPPLFGGILLCRRRGFGVWFSVFHVSLLSV
ncbi:hypothetical protein MtrunA17_Chr1g0171161 [Medicago truncatula]|uniref:Transmembrane protein n=1 Tax=Medicago truncatula TaxID=3880 RepID=A0A396JRR8_MEDTR|nr:hypothetical protein MtrunA17_Chr1g0171161 [Medicago truncatula]